MCARDRCRTRGVKRWRDFDHITAHKFDPGNIPQDRRCLRRGQPAPDRSPGPRRKGRVQGINIKSQVTGMSAKDLADTGCDRGRRRLMHFARVDDVHAQIIVDDRANPDLDRLRRVDKPLFYCLVEYRSVIDPVWVVVGPKIAVGVELQKSQGHRISRHGPAGSAAKWNDRRQVKSPPPRPSGCP